MRLPTSTRNVASHLGGKGKDVKDKKKTKTLLLANNHWRKPRRNDMGIMSNRPPGDGGRGATAQSAQRPASEEQEVVSPSTSVSLGISGVDVGSDGFHGVI